MIAAAAPKAPANLVAEEMVDLVGATQTPSTLFAVPRKECVLFTTSSSHPWSSVSTKLIAPKSPGHIGGYSFSQNMALLGLVWPSSKDITYASAVVSSSYLNEPAHKVSHMCRPELYTESIRLHPAEPCSS